VLPGLRYRQQNCDLRYRLADFFGVFSVYRVRSETAESISIGETDMSTAMENQRQTARLSSDFEVEVLTRAGESIRLGAGDISRGGLRMDCDAETAERLMGGSSDTEYAEEPELSLEFTLPSAVGTRRRVKVRSNVAYIKSAGLGRSSVGIRFRRFSGDGQEILEAYVLEKVRYG
jgi:hypothetical protein